MVRRCFYSFHYQNDAWRTAQVRNIGVIEGNKSTTDNHWEEIKKGGDKAIQMWIDSEMKGRTCTIVLIGSSTAGRRWINYEIKRSWDLGMGLTGIYIHGLLNPLKKTSPKGKNPFNDFRVGSDDTSLSSIVKCHVPKGGDSKEKFGWIRDNIEAIVEQAIRIRKNY